MSSWFPTPRKPPEVVVDAENFDDTRRFLTQAIDGLGRGGYARAARSALLQPNNLHRYVHGARLPRIDTFLRLVEALGFELVIRRKNENR